MAKVDPTGTQLKYCGYIGGYSDSNPGYEVGNDISVDPSGNAFITGATNSDRMFPVKIGPDLTYNGGISDAFVAKVDPYGSSLVYCGYIGGESYDEGWGIDASRGTAFVTGWTESNESTFPVKVGPDLTHNGQGDAFVARVQAPGRGLDFCGYIGGAGVDGGTGVAVDSQDNVYFSGYTTSWEATFPAFGGPDATYNGGVQDAFVGKALPTGASLIYCGYIGGCMWDEAGDLAVDANGNAYVAGGTYSDETSFPVRRGPALTKANQIYSVGFIAKVAEVTLAGSGATRPGGTVRLLLTATDDANLGYQLGSSLGTGPIPIDTRKLDLSPDNLLLVTVNDYWPWIFQGYRGVIDSKCQARAAIHIPNLPALIGVRLHSAFVTLSPSEPSGVKSISNTLTFTITK